MLEPDVQATLFATLRHPTTLAALASVGMHAALGLILPIFPAAPAESSGLPLGNVELVELNPAELRRLPPLEAPPLDELPPLDALPDLEDELLGLPPEPDAGRGDLPPDDLPAGRPPGLAGDPSLYSYNLDPAALMPIVPLPPAPGRAVVPPTRQTLRLPVAPARPAQRLSEASSTTAQVAPRFSLRTPNGGDRFQVRDYENPADLLPGRQPSPRADETGSVAARPEPSPQPPPSGDRPRTSQELAALRQQQLEAQGAARIQAQRLQLRTDRRNTSEAEVRRNEERWREAVSQAPRSTSLAGIYPRAACLRQLSGTAIYGITVSPNGSISDARLLQSAGYEIFNRQARSQVLANRYATADGPIPYRVSVSFRYDAANCPALTVPSPQRPADNPDSTPAPSPSTTPNPTAEEP